MGGADQKSDTRDATTGDKDLKKGRVILDWTPSQDLKVSLNLNGFTDNSDTLVAQETGLDLHDRCGAFFGTSLRYQSRSQGAFGTQNDLQQGLPSFEVRDYGILDLRAGVNTADGHWHLQVFGSNVTNTYYWNQVVRSGDVVVRFAGLPTMYWHKRLASSADCAPARTDTCIMQATSLASLHEIVTR